MSCTRSAGSRTLKGCAPPHTTSKRHSILSGIALALLIALIPSGPASAQPAPPKENPLPWTLRTPLPFVFEDSHFIPAFLSSLVLPDRNPLGANDWRCKPSAAHPEPVILIHGTWENAYNNWNGLSPILRAQGYCVFALNYGRSTFLPGLGATGDMIASAAEVAKYVAQVRQATGAAHVALIGHSQGGAQARFYANLLAPQGEVTKVIALTPSNHPTTLSGITTLASAFGVLGIGYGALDLVRMPSAIQQSTHSAFYAYLNGLNNNSETRPGITYTNITTVLDVIVTPYTQGNIKAGPGASVENFTIQSICRNDYSEHIGISYSRNVYQIVLNKLDPQHPHKVLCRFETAF